MKQTISGYRLGLSKKDRLDAKRLHDKKKPQVPLPPMRVGWKKALRKLEACRTEKKISIQEIFFLLSGSASRTSIDEDMFVTRLCKLLGPHVISRDDALSLSKKLLAQRKTGYIVAKDLMSILNIQEDDPSHIVFPDWLLQRQDFCAIQNNDLMECNVRNLRVVSAARACQTFRTPGDNKCIFNWMKLNCSFLTKHYTDKLMDFCRELEFQEFSEKVIIFQQGESTRPGAYMILTGIVNIIKNGSKIGTLSADAYFGEKSLLGGENADFRNITVETVVPTKVLFISKPNFIRIISNPTQYPARQDVALFLCNYCAPFRHFPFQHILDTSRRIAIQNYNGLDQVILRQHDRPAGLYVIKSGVVDITRVISIKKVLKSLDDDNDSSNNNNSILQHKATDANEANNKKCSDAMVRLTVATLRRGNIIGEACLQNMLTHFMGYSAVTASENVEIYYLGEEECLKYLFKSEFKEDKKECLKDIKYYTEMRRIADADLVLKFEKEIRTELMQRKLRHLNLQPVRNNASVAVVANDSNNKDNANPVNNGEALLPKPESTPFRDQYNHRLNCLGLDLGIGPARARRSTTVVPAPRPPAAIVPRRRGEVLPRRN
jgi:CRP-like cAMP-binding protein